MADRFRGSRPLVRGARRQTQWGLGVGSTAVTTITASSATILGAGVTFGASGTIVRQRGALSAYLTAATAVGDGFHGAIGIGIVGSQAFATGASALPSPVTEGAWDGWMYHRFFGIHRGAAGAGSEGAAAIQFEVDTKAMRKVSDEMVVVAMLEFIEIGTATADVFFDTRLLLKLG